jgi:hypothetical protein
MMWASHWWLFDVPKEIWLRGGTSACSSLPVPANRFGQALLHGIVQVTLSGHPSTNIYANSHW